MSGTAKAPYVHRIPEIPQQFITRLKHAGDKDFIKAEGLIYLGHLQGLKRIDTQVLQYPTAEDPIHCVARAEVETDLGVFSDYGTVNVSNRGQVGGSYPVELACTRARNRALRQATNCPLTSYEEMGMASEEEQPTAQENGQQVSTPPAEPTPALNPVAAARDAAKAAAGPPRRPADPARSADDEPATQAQWDKLLELCSYIQERWGHTIRIADAYTQRGAQIAITEAKALGRELKAKEEAALASVPAK